MTEMYNVNPIVPPKESLYLFIYLFIYLFVFVFFWGGGCFPVHILYGGIPLGAV